MAKKSAQTLWDDVRVWLTDATRTAIREAEDLTRRGRLKMDIMNLSRKIERKMAQLGGRVYDRASTEPDTPVTLDAEMKRLVQSIARLEEQRTAKQQEYEAEKKRKTRSG